MPKKRVSPSLAENDTTPPYTLPYADSTESSHLADLKEPRQLTGRITKDKLARRWVVS